MYRLPGLGKFLQDPVMFLGKPDRLWMVEIERCFGFPDHYTDIANLHPDKRLHLLGMSWSVACVRHFMQPLLQHFKSTLPIPSKLKLDYYDWIVGFLFYREWNKIPSGRTDMHKKDPPTILVLHQMSYFQNCDLLQDSAWTNGSTDRHLKSRHTRDF